MSPNGQDRRQGNSSVVISLLLVVIGALLGVIVLLLWMPERVRPANETTEREVAKAPSPAPASLPEASESRQDAPSDAKAPAPAPTSPPKTTQSKKNEAPAAKAPAPPPPPPKRIGNPERIREVLQVGKTYESTLKVGLQASVLDADWGVRKTVTLNYVVENRTRRKVERNDGQTIVVLFHVVESRVVKLLSEVDISFDLGQPGIRLLAALDGWLTAGQGTAVAIAVAPLAEMILNEAGQAAVEQTVSKAVGMIDSLEGKKVRITYVDGEGVKSVEPVACSLDEAERDYLKGLALLSDCYILPDVQSKPGSFWDVEAAALVDLLPPTWRGRPSGVVTITRGQDFREKGKTFASLEMSRGTFRVNASDNSRRRLGDVTPRGKLSYNIDDGYVQSATLTATGRLEDVSTDHLLFETRFQSSPKLEIRYLCTILD
jgi:hypothetical protein